MKAYQLPKAKYSDIVSSIGSNIGSESSEVFDKKGNDVVISNSHKVCVVEILPAIVEWSKKLEKTKAKLDKYYSEDESSKSFNKILRLFDHFKDVKYKILSEFEGQYVSNGWMKFWEIIFYFKLIPRKEKLDSFSVFCNECLPGSDILSINHFISSKTQIKKMKWYASSSYDKESIKDDYNLYKNYPENWIISRNTKRDVCSMEMYRLVQEKINNSVSLYTSDLSFDASSDYNSQEDLYSSYNLGQIVSAFLSLNNGGNMVVKMYTFFTPFSMSLLTVLSTTFDKVYITKPVTSKSTNSEIYIVGIGFYNYEIITNYLMRRLENISVDKSPLINSSAITNWKEYQNIFLSASAKIFGEQIKSIDTCISTFEKYGDKAQKAKKEIDEITGHSSIIEKWYIDYPLKKIRSGDKLTVESGVDRV